MSDIAPNRNAESAATAESTPAETRPDLQTRKAQRLQELSASALEKPDPKQALLSAAGAESLELSGLVVNAARPAALEIADPGERLKLLKSAASAFGNLARLGEKLA
ncbi:MAG TPA: hypothetical protein VMV10_20660 [Pirellulales bacterium]|nr:hypothetical protein [Pirellulales bacterium]